MYKEVHIAGSISAFFFFLNYYLFERENMYVHMCAYEQGEGQREGQASLPTGSLMQGLIPGP